MKLLVAELWGVGDLALAIPFLQIAAAHAEVHLLAKPHAAPLLKRFCPTVHHIELQAPWTVFQGKYRLHRWPWSTLNKTIRNLRQMHFDAAVSARRDPRDHVLMVAAGASRRLGFGRAGSGMLLTENLPQPDSPHRIEHWRRLAGALSWDQPEPSRRTEAPNRRIIIHTGAAQPTRCWPEDRYTEIGRRLTGLGWEVSMIDDRIQGLDRLLNLIDGSAAFIGNDSGPGHLAALLGVPTFTVFGPQLPKLFHPVHPNSNWIEGAACPYKPCFDSCRYASPFCIMDLTTEMVWARISHWLETHLKSQYQSRT